MKALIIYYSMYNGHTKIIAQSMAEVIGAELINAEELNDIDALKYDLIGFGSGVYNQSMHPVLSEIIEKINLKDKNVFVFSTSAAGIEMYNKNVISLLSAKGAVLNGSFACKGYYSNNLLKIIGGINKGRPNDNDIKNANDFAKKIYHN